MSDHGWRVLATLHLLRSLDYDPTLTRTWKLRAFNPYKDATGSFRRHARSINSPTAATSMSDKPGLPVELPPRYAELKKQIAASYPDFEQNATRAWREIIEELNKFAETIQKGGSSVGFWDIEKSSGLIADTGALAVYPFR
jgi:hypothetical protein